MISIESTCSFCSVRPVVEQWNLQGQTPTSLRGQDCHRNHKPRFDSSTERWSAKSEVEIDMRKLKSDSKEKVPQKAMWWRCECGTKNHAPALQTDDNGVVCSKCQKEARFGDVKKVK